MKLGGTLMPGRYTGKRGMIHMHAERGMHTRTHIHRDRHCYRPYSTIIIKSRLLLIEATRGVAGFRVAYRLGGSLIRAPDNEESELSTLLLMLCG